MMLSDHLKPTLEGIPQALVTLDILLMNRLLNRKLTDADFQRL
jgi:hypothetical protein